MDIKLNWPRLRWADTMKDHSHSLRFIDLFGKLVFSRAASIRTFFGFSTQRSSFGWAYCNMLASKLPTIMLPLLYGIVAASPFSHSHSVDLHPRAACAGNTPTTRNEWCDFSIDTDYANVVPDTGVTREYWIELTDVMVAPDGVSRPALAINVSLILPYFLHNY